jgi:DNA polymerase alpha zinc finger protein
MEPLLTWMMQGLDPGRYRSTTVTEFEERRFSALESQLPDSERYKDAAPFVVRCRACECSVGFAPVSNRTVCLFPPFCNPVAILTAHSRSRWSKLKGSRAPCAIRPLARRACKSSSNARFERTFTGITKAGPSVMTHRVEIARV